jgi:hypothetical protein
MPFLFLVDRILNSGSVVSEDCRRVQWLLCTMLKSKSKLEHFRAFINGFRLDVARRTAKHRSLLCFSRASPSVVQSSGQGPFTSEIVGSILATDSCEKSQSTLCRKSWVFSGCSGFLPQGKLTGWVRIIPLTDPSTVAVRRDQT